MIWIDIPGNFKIKFFFSKLFKLNWESGSYFNLMASFTITRAFENIDLFEEFEEFSFFLWRFSWC